MQSASSISLAFVLLVAASGVSAGELHPEPARPTSRVDCARVPGEPPAMRGITAANNRVRTRAFGTSRSSATLEWSCNLATVAQAYAEELAAHGCRLAHSGNRYGENLYGSYGFEPTPEHVVDDWAAESACTQSAPILGDSTCVPVDGVCSVCGHYTQIVWPQTRRVGCGVASCGEERVWVCNYDPPGNVHRR